VGAVAPEPGPRGDHRLVLLATLLVPAALVVGFLLLVEAPAEVACNDAVARAARRADVDDYYRAAVVPLVLAALVGLAAGLWASARLAADGRPTRLARTAAWMVTIVAVAAAVSPTTFAILWFLGLAAAFWLPVLALAAGLTAVAYGHPQRVPGLGEAAGGPLYRLAAAVGGVTLLVIVATDSDLVAVTVAVIVGLWVLLLVGRALWERRPSHDTLRLVGFVAWTVALVLVPAGAGIVGLEGGALEDVGCIGG
jgi:hypothetical protein